MTARARPLDEADRLRLGRLHADPFIDCDPVRADELTPPTWLDDADREADEGQRQSETAERMPPHDLDAERAILAEVLCEPTSIEHAVMLEPPMFFSEAHRRVWEAIRALHDAGETIEALHVVRWLEQHDRLAQVGGREYVAQIIDQRRYPVRVAAWVQLVLDAWRARRAIEVAHRVAAMGYAGTDAGALVASAVAELGQLAKDAAPANGLHVVSAAEVWKPLEPPEYLIEPVLVRGSLALLVAYGASLKTWIMLDGGLSVATGEQWLVRFATRQGRALIVDFESGDYELRRRLHKIARGRGWAIPVEGLSFASMPEHNLADERFFDALRPLAASHAFVGIDSLAAGSGGIDENDARFATSLQRLKAIAVETGAVILVLHHSRKGSGDDVDERELVRGSSAIFNACDVVLQLRRADEGAFVLRQTKARGGKAVEPFLVRVDDTDDGGALVVGRDLDEQEPASAGSATIDRAKARIISLLAHERDLRSGNEIHRRLRGTKKTNLEALKELQERGTVVRHEGAFRLASEVQS